MDDVSARDPEFTKELEAALDEFYRGDMAEVVSLTRGDLTFLIALHLNSSALNATMMSYINSIHQDGFSASVSRGREIQNRIRDQNSVLIEFLKKLTSKAAA
ncbi:hypothetical protein [Blastochloris sulfoviridis]|uniref:Uncharacterized protein n=1 Tax=Blastochloris sulfoviridis TaxID=50712 RepID=A0A5M6I4G0_9HYPH|nr:hypothetical protein [Blastochloris sulfoviridis]KAA5603111.1 hypothetical protein F1193_02470 [Blastochloris sulfoviridis]